MGNALLAYARLNVRNGLHMLYQSPWDDAHFCEPAVVEISDNIDLRQAWFIVEKQILVLSAKHSPDDDGWGEMLIDNLWRLGDWDLHVEGAISLSGRSGLVEHKTSSVLAKREGNTLRLSMRLAEMANIWITWNNS